MMDIQGRDRPEQNYFFLARFFAFGVNGAGGDASKRLSALSARFSAASSTGGRASFLRFSIRGRG